MTAVLPELDVELSTDTPKLCDVYQGKTKDDKNPKLCGALATHEVIVTCRHSHERSRLMCRHHLTIAQLSGMVCRVCIDNNDPDYDKWSLYVVAVWEI